MSLEVLKAALADRYRLERELGAGGMATVYLAHDLKHDRRVAIKVMKPEVSAELAADRFLREIRTTANLQHPNIVPVFDSGKVDGQWSMVDGGGSSAIDHQPSTLLYFVMPLIEGETLRDRLEREKILPVDEAIRLVREVADALQYAHDAGILHRDLKPENVMLSRGHALLADFGIARTAAKEDDRLTRTGSSVGTPAYMSPEQATGERELTAASDVYGLAAILFELLTGEPPFTGPTPQAILVKRFTSEAPPVRTLRNDAPAGCEAAVARALASDPDRRFTTAAAFAAALVSGEVPAAAPAPPVDANSLVVLPCVNAGGGAEDEQFADGLTEEIITDLARVKALRVLSRTSSMQLKGTTKSVSQLGRELKVRYALSGSVRRAGNSLRITAELIDAATDTPVWAERFSGTMDDIFDVQERVAREIVKAMGVTLSASEEHRLAERPIKSVRAFELFLQARQAMQRYDLQRGHALLDQAIAIEGDVPALRALKAYGMFALVRMGEDRSVLPEVEAEAEALIDAAPDAPFGHALKGFAAYERGDLALAVRSFRAAEARDPNDADVLFHLGISLQAAGQVAETAATSARLMSRDPLAPFSHLLAGTYLWFVGRAAEGVPLVEHGLAIEPESVISHWGMGYTYAVVGMQKEARREANWLLQRAPQLPYTAQVHGLVTALEGGHERALAILRPVNWGALDAHHTFHLSESFAMAGDPATALMLLERAVDNGFYPVDYFTDYCPFMAPLRGTPEFDRIAARARQRVEEFAA